MCAIVCSPNAYCDGGTCKTRVTEFPVGRAGAKPQAITVGADGNLWFTDGPKIGKITTAGKVTEFDAVSAAALPNPGTTVTTSATIAAGSDGNIWSLVLLSNGVASVVKLTPEGVSTEFPYSSSSPQPSGIVSGPDGNMWFIERASSPQSNSNKFYVCTPAGTIVPHALPLNMSLGDIVLGSDGNLWAADPVEGILKITRNSMVTLLGPKATGVPRYLATGSDHNVWFTEWTERLIGRFNGQGNSDEFAVPEGTGEPYDITAGPHDDLWFSQPDYHAGELHPAIGRITNAGQVTSFDVPSNAEGIVTGPDKNIWFTEPEVGKIGRFLAP